MAQIPGPARERLLKLLGILEHRFPEVGLISSARIEALTGWARDTIRKDISFLGDNGEAPGSSGGYRTELLGPSIKKALGLDRKRKFCVVGLGRLGSACLDGVSDGGFELAAGFDINVNRVEILSAPAPLYPAYKMGEVIPRFGIELALLCVPAHSAQAAAEKLAASGIRGIVNFAPVVLSLPPELAVRNVYVTEELRALAVTIA
ncbi:MAG: CoA-binding protein [Treponema sp.]|jgi:redox-sensing transcriptional repressor|nr:CoA-binding protein [Treponema sp.]